MNHQKTIKQSVTMEGLGLFTGQPCVMRFEPAEVNSGIVFVRKNDGSPPLHVPCDIANVVKRPRLTALANADATVLTVEHVLSAVAGVGIDNLTIELSADETPSIDGSPLPYVETLLKAGIQQQSEPRNVFVIDEPITVNHKGTSLTALPGPTDCLEIIYELNYNQCPAIGKQTYSFSLGRDDYAAEIAPARTFALKEEALQFQAMGIGTHLGPRDIVIMGDEGIIDNELRFSDEPVRHKLGDLIGDLMLTGQPLAGRIIASMSGHGLNQAMAAKLQQASQQRKQEQAYASDKPIMDIRKVMRLLPHRYPFLMIDRVIEMDDEKRAVAIKNVTINEPFFQGHYPGEPIMPGVLILEAMAQLSGLLLSRRLEHSGKVAVLLSIDRVKMRRPVRPGDQLILEAEPIRVRARSGHCRCRAKVGGNLVAEAEIKFMLIDADVS